MSDLAEQHTAKLKLTKIKIAGFKSFVDPTVVHVSSNLVAVVGPNGCGKSNIIDAVVWVMGESSAKYLRGESLTDVIFNGSSARKPVGQASVELIFDNSEGAIGGEYASYAEISIRRVITREAESSYFLNGTRCRRRDITDIFLGTGLGPRSYSIIGQNMISRLIEAKPEDMRVYMEEAAGISKYKERRRETENRIQHTKDNLARLNDLRTELDKQLSSLQRQANAAERYKTLKQEERTLRSQWLTIQWRQLDSQLVQNTLLIQQQETSVEARQAQISDLDRTLERNRNEQHAANDVFQEIQRRFYAVGNEITRIEQDIHHHQDRQRLLQNDLAQVNEEIQQAQTQLDELEDELRELVSEQETLAPETEEAMTVAANYANELVQAEEAVNVLQTQWDEFNQRTAKATQTAQVEQTRIQHFEQKITSLAQRKTKLQQEQEQIDFSELEADLATLSQRDTELVTQTQEHETQLAAIRNEIIGMRTAQQDLNSTLNQVNSDLQKARGQQASLDALQKTALGQRNNQVMPWLAQHQLDQKPRLAQGIDVASGWEHAVEKVLGSYLQAVCVDSIADVANKLNELKEGSLCAVSKQESPTPSSQKAPTLLSKVTSQWPLESLLGAVYVADTLDDALSLSASLASHESVITPEGVWLGSSWMRVARDENPEAGVFQREQELKQLTKHIETLEAKKEELETRFAEGRDKLADLERQRDQLQQTLSQDHAQVSDIQAQMKIKQSRLTELTQRIERLKKECEECDTQLQQAEGDLTTARTQWQTAMSELENQSSRRDELVQARDAARNTLQTVRQQVNQTKEHAHQLEIRLQTTNSQQNSLSQQVQQIQSQMATLMKRKATLDEEFNTAMPFDSLEKNLNSALARRLLIEEEMKTARDSIQSIDQELTLLENKRQEMERDLNKVRDALTDARMEWQGQKVKTETLLEQMKESGTDLEEVIKTLPEQATAEDWHAQLETVGQRISRLGAINLVAIEEYATCSERKQYLDKQNDDLQEGLATLENAIAKIDKETRARFKETFDLVNTRFQELFPRIFGGGRAYLELTGENLLDAGIAVMACPPGKRNSTIHLLSGGEKAMTAIALVFSIFHLNPAPFCLLDEVDAPLDDANIGRFCQLVKSMSDKTQFIFISHNKLAIEMAEHMMGVTMHEPGVSRLVSVNVEEAISMAGA